MVTPGDTATLVAATLAISWSEGNSDIERFHRSLQ
jgi:hypothetical protein